MYNLEIKNRYWKRRINDFDFPFYLPLMGDSTRGLPNVHRTFALTPFSSPILEFYINKKTENFWSFLFILVPLMGLEPIWFPAGFWIQCVYQFRHSGICEIYFHTISHFFLLVYNFFCKLLKFIFLIVTIYIIKIQWETRLFLL